eukprot:9197367-Heterocapsa_arctica.AAC.1
MHEVPIGLGPLVEVLALQIRELVQDPRRPPPEPDLVGVHAVAELRPYVGPREGLQRAQRPDDLRGQTAQHLGDVLQLHRGIADA